MSMYKLSLATALLLSLTACSSGGKSGGTTDDVARQENAKLQTQLNALQTQAETANKKAEQATKRAEAAEQAVANAQNNTKEIEALKREAASAKQAAATAQKAAEQATKRAELAEQAIATSQNNNAKEIEALKREAVSAKQAATTAQKAAEQATKRAELAEQAATTSQNNNAKEIEALKREAANVKQAATAAQKTAEQATKRAEIAEQAVATSQNNAKEIEVLKREAASAKQAATDAQKTAEQATKRAETAEQAVATSQNNAKEIEALKREAESAKQAAAKAQQEAEQAKNNLNSVLNSLDETVANSIKRIEQAEQKKYADLENTRKEIAKLAIENGLEEWEANTFSYEYQEKGIDEARTALERLKQEKIALAEKKQKLEKLASDKGLDTNAAQYFASNNLHTEESKITESLNNEIANQASQKKLNALNHSSSELTISITDGFTAKTRKVTIPIRDNNGFETGGTHLKSYNDIYNQKYSLISGQYYDNNDNPAYDNKIYGVSYNGLETLEKNMPVEGTATYNGVAFAYERQGKLNYNVNFATKEGQGQITEMPDIGTLTLEKGNIGKRYDRTMGIAGNVVAENWKNIGVSGQYLLDFYGPQAEEIAGSASLRPADTYSESSKPFNQLKPTQSSYEPLNIGFGGTRGDIQK